MFSEDNIIKLIKQLSKKSFPINSKKVIGIGDDCAVIPKDKTHSYLISTDALVENTHFLKNAITPYDLAYKAISVNVSDVAAMGGKPLFLFISVGLNNSLSDKWLKTFITSINKVAKIFSVLVLGGDTVKSEKEIFINITIIGESLNKNIKYRNNANDKDILAVTGNLGDSKFGLNILLNKIDNKNRKYFIKKHYNPKIFHKEGQFLASRKSITSMMDVSDGLKSDLVKLCKSSGVGADVDLSKVPISKKLRSHFNSEMNAKLFAASGGEDYVLLFTVKPNQFQSLKNTYFSNFKTKIFAIGVINNNKDIIEYNYDQNDISNLLPSEFEHF